MSEKFGVRRVNTTRAGASHDILAATAQSQAVVAGNINSPSQPAHNSTTSQKVETTGLSTQQLQQQQQQQQQQQLWQQQQQKLWQQQQQQLADQRAAAALAAQGQQRPEPDILNKDKGKGLSKDAITRTESVQSNPNQGASQSGTGNTANGAANSQSSQNTMTGQGGQNTMTGQGGQNTITSQGGQTPVDTMQAYPVDLQPQGPADNRPIGLKEAGIYPAGSNTTEPAVKILTGYKSSTVFAITGIILIALAIIIGPIICMLCKMKEKREEKQRKIRALKNREVSENNIIESLMLQDLASKEKMMSVSNEGALGATCENYYKTDDIYQTIDPELERLNKGGRSSPTGRLP